MEKMVISLLNDGYSNTAVSLAGARQVNCRNRETEISWKVAETILIRAHGRTSNEYNGQIMMNRWEAYFEDVEGDEGSKDSPAKRSKLGSFVFAASGLCTPWGTFKHLLLPETTRTVG